MKGKKVYIAHSLVLSDKVEHYVKFIESIGYTTYFPQRDTNQKGSILDILTANLQGIIWCDEVHVIWNGKSYGTIFDLGNAYALKKRIKVIHVDKIKGVKLSIKSWYAYLYSHMGGHIDEYW